MNKNPLNLEPKAPDTKCNARTPNGYCKNKAGYKTMHPGEGRCYYHGGNTPVRVHGDPLFQSIYTKALPSSLAIELTEIQRDPLFSTLFQEFSILRLIVSGLLNQLPADLSTIYGRPVCSECGKHLGKILNRDDPTDEGAQMVIDVDWEVQWKRLTKLISTIETMSRVFEKISKHEERQKRFIQVSELEGLMVQWGKILMKYLGNDSRIKEIQQELMDAGFLRQPGAQDEEKLAIFRRFQTKADNTRTKMNKRGKKVIVADAVAEVIPEFVEIEVLSEKNGNDHWKKKKNVNRVEVTHDGILD